MPSWAVKRWGRSTTQPASSAPHVVSSVCMASVLAYRQLCTAIRGALSKYSRPMLAKVVIRGLLLKGYGECSALWFVSHTI